jgi:hypothetical protein
MGRSARWDIVTCMLLHVGLIAVAGESPSSTTPRNLVLGTQNGLLVQARSHAASLIELLWVGQQDKKCCHSVPEDIL